MKAIAFSNLIHDMKLHKIEKEHYSFIYNHFTFDIILSLTANAYEILIAIHACNWGCVLEMDRNLNVYMQDNDYYSLCKILKLNWNNDHFNSFLFLRLLSEKAPATSNKQGVDYRYLQKYLSYRNVDEKEKIYFCRWNDHITDKRIAHNFDKTEFYFGPTVANYCRRNNISSLWTADKYRTIHYSNPWD